MMLTQFGKSLAKSAARTLLPRPLLVRVLAYRAIARKHNPELTLLPHFNRGGIFVDVGANIGDFSRVGCLTFSHVVAFEPIPELAETLRRELPGKVDVRSVALSDSPGTATLYIPVSNGRFTTGLSSLSRTANPSEEFRYVTVSVQTLDGAGLDGVDLIKIDVEGLEEEVLRGGLTLLRRERPGLIVEIEDRHHPGRTPEIFDLLRNLGYLPFFFRDDRLCPVSTVDGNPASYNLDSAGNYIPNFVLIHPSRFYPELRQLVDAN